MIRIGRRHREVARRPWAEARCWALDLELSGLDPARGRIMAVGMVPLRNRVIHAGEAYASLVRVDGPGAARPGGDGPGAGGPASGASAGGGPVGGAGAGIDMSGVVAHHLLPDRLAAAPPLGLVVAEIDRRLDGHVLVVHGGSVDVPFLRRAYEEVGRPWPDPPVIDTLRLLQRHENHRLAGPVEGGEFPGGLAAARARFGLPPHEAHDALADAVATAELLLVLAHRLRARTVGDLL